MHLMLDQPWIPTLGAIWCSTERKAIDGARIIADAVGLKPRTLHELGENDRSATGFLPAPEFEATADAFFRCPDLSVRGWETAFDAQRRIVAAIGTVLVGTPAQRDVAIVAHGGVGALLLCHLKGCPVSRGEDQPGNGGGNYYRFDLNTHALRHGWHPIDLLRS